MTHGGKREGAGRKPLLLERLHRITLSLPRAYIDRLKAIGDGNASAGVRRLLDKETKR